jgi:hypothetical protein
MAACRPAARSRSPKRDRARPPEDEKVRGRTRPALASTPALAPHKLSWRLDYSVTAGSAFILPGLAGVAWAGLAWVGFANFALRWALPISLKH